LLGHVFTVLLLKVLRLVIAARSFLFLLLILFRDLFRQNSLSPWRHDSAPFAHAKYAIMRSTTVSSPSPFFSLTFRNTSQSGPPFLTQSLFFDLFLFQPPGAWVLAHSTFFPRRARTLTSLRSPSFLLHLSSFPPAVFMRLFFAEGPSRRFSHFPFLHRRTDALPHPSFFGRQVPDWPVSLHVPVASFSPICGCFLSGGGGPPHSEFRTHPAAHSCLVWTLDQPSCAGFPGLIYVQFPCLFLTSVVPSPGRAGSFSLFSKVG